MDIVASVTYKLSGADYKQHNLLHLTHSKHNAQ